MTKEILTVIVVVTIILGLLVAVVSVDIRRTDARRILKRDIEYEVRWDNLSFHGCDLRISPEGALTITDLDGWSHTLWPPYKFRPTGERCSELLKDGEDR